MFNARCPAQLAAPPPAGKASCARPGAPDSDDGCAPSAWLRTGEEGMELTNGVNITNWLTTTYY